MLRYLISVVALLCFYQIATAQPPARAQSVIVAQAGPRNMAPALELLATVRARESVDISASVAERIERIAFQQGQRVEQGQLLVELAHAAEAARLRSAQALHDQARAQLKRVQELRGQELASAAELDVALAETQLAAAAVDEAQAALDERMIHAPFAGVLGLRDVSPGAYVAAGDVITTLQDVSRLELEFQLPQEAVALWAQASLLPLRVPALDDAQFTAKPAFDAGQLSPDSRSLRARAVLQQASTDLRPGMLAVISLQTQSQAVLAIPEAALIPHDQGYSVFVLEAGQAQQIKLSIGQRQRGWVAVRQGLSAGQQVVIHGGSKLRSGSPVKVLGRYDGSVPIAQMIRQVTD